LGGSAFLAVKHHAHLAHDRGVAAGKLTFFDHQRDILFAEELDLILKDMHQMTKLILIQVFGKGALAHYAAKLRLQIFIGGNHFGIIVVICSFQGRIIGMLRHLHIAPGQFIRNGFV